MLVIWRFRVGRLASPIGWDAQIIAYLPARIAAGAYGPNVFLSCLYPEVPRLTFTISLPGETRIQRRYVVPL